MASMIAVKLDRALASVSLLRDEPVHNELAPDTAVYSANEAEQAVCLKALETQKDLYHHVCLTLESLLGRLNELYEDIFSSHQEAIARLSVEIARKILMQKVAEGDYSIEAIIQEALKTVPDGPGIVVRVNPNDLKSLRILQDTEGTKLSEIDFTADAGIGPAECVIESPRGIIKCLIDEHLERIHKALSNTE